MNRRPAARLSRILRGTSIALAFAFPAQALAEPAIWIVRTANCTAYLLGTRHVLKADTPWLTPKVEAAFEAAQELWVEDGIAPPSGQPVVIQSPPPPAPAPALALSQEDSDRLDGALKAAGLDRKVLGQMGLGPERIMSLLLFRKMEAAGIEMEFGADEVLAAMAGGRSIPVKSIDPPLPPPIQKAIADRTADEGLVDLKDYLRRSDEILAQVSKEEADWSNGNLDAISVGQARDAKADHTRYRQMVSDRNLVFAKAIKERMNAPGTIFVAIGVGHFVGPDNLIDLLKAEGLNPTRH